MVQDTRNNAFQSLKPVCVKLNFLVSKPGLSPDEPELLTTLEEFSESLRNTLNASNSSSQLIRYVFFPIAGLLRHFAPTELPERGSIAIFKALDVISKVWLVEGISIAEWEQIWVLATMSLISSIKNRKSEVLLLSCVDLLYTLSINPLPSYIELLTDKRMSILGSLISQILDMATTHKFLDLRIRSLNLIGVYVGVYAFDKPNINAILLPGTASSMTKVLSGNSHINSDLAVAAVDILRLIIMSTLQDARCASLQPIQISDLIDLADKVDLENLEIVDTKDDDRAIPVASSLFAPPPTEKKEDDIRSTSWLKATSHQIRLVLTSIAGLTKHQSSRVRRGMADLSADILETCLATLETCQRTLLSNLLILSIDSQSSDNVSSIAKGALARLLSLGEHQKILEPLLKQHARELLVNLPNAIRSKDNSAILGTTLQIEAIANLTISQSGIPMDDILGPQGGVEKWSWGLIDCIPFYNPPVSGESVSVNASRSVLWSSTPDAAFDLRFDEAGDDPWFGFPSMPFATLDTQAGEGIRKALVALGKAFGGRASHSAEYFFNLAQRNLNRKASISSLWLCCCIIQGMSLSRSRVTQKLALKFVRNVVKFSQDAENSTDEIPTVEETGEDVVKHNEKNLPTEYIRGLEKVETLADNFKYTPQKSAKLEKKVRLTLISLMSLRMITTTSWILGYDFRPQLNNTLYYILSRLDSPTMTIREHAKSTLASVSYFVGYASTSGSILDNADYLLNSVASHLSPVRLDIAAPRVLIAAVRLVGAPLVGKLQGVVEDIFESLDNFHDIPLLGEGLLAVLDTIVSVMSEDVDVLPSYNDEEDTDRIISVDSRPNPELELEGLAEWLQELNQDPPEQPPIEDYGPTPQQAWDELREGHDVNKETVPEDKPHEPLNRSQSICLKIMSKGLHFLTHESAFLRARTMMLLSNSVRVLMRENRKADVLPVVHKAWPYVLHRLLSRAAAGMGDECEENPYVMASAFELIRVLAVETGEFMSLRIIEDAYPLIRRTLCFNVTTDVRNSGRDVSTTKIVSDGIEYWNTSTTAKRAHRELVQAMTAVVKEIPVKDELVWQLSSDFRLLMQHSSLKKELVLLYEALSVRNVDIVWLVMQENDTLEISSVVDDIAFQ
ncbi:hypothetical protein E3Q16_01910 [Wallemia mellicola]|uniref:ARM repeat-containing protein n=2 Tax=Wallemia mellicola TaxID=1708541 RepID=A0AB38MZS6_9BASI|nr:hypothetical protein E3Q16_01910 [Wallemia mellicola]TIC64818.1 hypothetical protein E3Q02_02438 [Wallemia mellicola]